MGRDASAATFTQIWGFEAIPPHWLFLITSVLFISLSFWGLSKRIDPGVIRTYKIRALAVTMATQSLSQAEFEGAEAQSLEDIVSLQGDRSRLVEK